MPLLFVSLWTYYWIHQLSGMDHISGFKKMFKGTDFILYLEASKTSQRLLVKSKILLDSTWHRQKRLKIAFTTLCALPSSFCQGPSGKVTIPQFLEKKPNKTTNHQHWPRSTEAELWIEPDKVRVLSLQLEESAGFWLIRKLLNKLYCSLCLYHCPEDYTEKCITGGKTEYQIIEACYMDGIF